MTSLALALPVGLVAAIPPAALVAGCTYLLARWLDDQNPVRARSRRILLTLALTAVLTGGAANTLIVALANDQGPTRTLVALLALLLLASAATAAAAGALGFAARRDWLITHPKQLTYPGYPAPIEVDSVVRVAPSADRPPSSCDTATRGSQEVPADHRLPEHRQPQPGWPFR